MADQISDAVLDGMLKGDPGSRVAVETLITTGQVHVAGEVTTETYVDIPGLIREKILEIGYDSSAKGYDGASCGVSVSIGSQSPDIAQGVREAFEHREGEGSDELDRQGAGDQGLMFGYACRETPELMPLPIMLAHRLARRLSAVRRSGDVPYIRPDGKTQVTIEYSGGKPVRLDTVVVSTQHAPAIDLKELLAPDVRDHVVLPIISDLEIDTSNYRLLVNPTGRFEVGGPMGDAGLTGRKIIIDTYGGMARHGGGAFSGKDPSKVDRSAAYAMRWVAKNVVAAGLAESCETQVAYAIGKAKPVGLFVECFGSEQVPVETHPGRRARGVRPAAGRDHPGPGPAPAHLLADCGVRALRPRGARLLLGAHRPHRRAALGRRVELARGLPPTPAMASSAVAAVPASPRRRPPPTPRPSLQPYSGRSPSRPSSRAKPSRTAAADRQFGRPGLVGQSRGGFGEAGREGRRESPAGRAGGRGRVAAAPGPALRLPGAGAARPGRGARLPGPGAVRWPADQRLPAAAGRGQPARGQARVPGAGGVARAGAVR